MSTPTTQLEPLNPVLERKRKHKLTEQRGRQKINNQINTLKEMLPECRYVPTTKASVLECTIQTLTKLQALCNQLVIQNKKLQAENASLREELGGASPNHGADSPQSSNAIHDNSLSSEDDSPSLQRRTTQQTITEQPKPLANPQFDLFVHSEDASSAEFIPPVSEVQQQPQQMPPSFVSQPNNDETAGFFEGIPTGNDFSLFSHPVLNNNNNNNSSNYNSIVDSMINPDYNAPQQDQTSLLNATSFAIIPSTLPSSLNAPNMANNNNNNNYRLQFSNNYAPNSYQPSANSGSSSSTLSDRKSVV